MSYTDLQLEVEGLLPGNGLMEFGPAAVSPARRDSIQILPANFGGNIPTNGFVRLNVFSPRGDIEGFGFETSITGFVELNIFVQAGQGERRAYLVADELDRRYGGVTQGSTTFTQSTIAVKGIDNENPQLWRLDYRVPFTRYN